MQPREVLGVGPGASRQEITDAYRRYALRHHPDRGGDPAAFQAGVDAYRGLVAGRPGPTADPVTQRPGARGDVVFHRRRRAGIRSLLRLAHRHRRPTRSLS
jgi:hypothetical protein